MKLAILALMLALSAKAETNGFMSCTDWKKTPYPLKLGYIKGISDGLVLADLDLAKRILPIKTSYGDVSTQIDLLCAKMNSTFYIWMVLTEIKEQEDKK
jgi:hypothetical protein